LGTGEQSPLWALKAALSRLPGHILRTLRLGKFELPELGVSAFRVRAAWVVYIEVQCIGSGPQVELHGIHGPVQGIVPQLPTIEGDGHSGLMGRRMVRGMRVAVVQPQEKIPVSILFEPWEYSAVDLLGRGIETAVVRKVSKILFKTTLYPHFRKISTTEGDRDCSFKVSPLL
jgi:hypothetical protein